MTPRMNPEWKSELESLLSKAPYTGSLHWDEPLAKHTYFRIGGPASLLVTPKTNEELSILFKCLEPLQIPFFILGKGSNVLAADDGFSGVVIKTTYLNTTIDTVIESGKSQLILGAGVALTMLLKRAGDSGWGGFEFLAGIPGTVGGAIAMNAGTHLGEVKDRLTCAETFENGKLKKIQGSELKYSYRKNHFLKSGSVVVRSWWNYEPRESKEITSLISETLQRRKATQPIDFPSCGSTFKNPLESGLKAWQVVEKIGLKGHQIGKAQFSEKHCNFILNHGGATSADVSGLINLAKDRAYSQLGIQLEEEVQYLR